MVCPVHEGFDPLSDEFLADPYAVMPTIGEPVFYAPALPRNNRRAIGTADHIGASRERCDWS